MFPLQAVETEKRRRARVKLSVSLKECDEGYYVYKGACYGPAYRPARPPTSGPTQGSEEDAP